MRITRRLRAKISNVQTSVVRWQEFLFFAVITKAAASYIQKTIICHVTRVLVTKGLFEIITLEYLVLLCLIIYNTLEKMLRLLYCSQRLKCSISAGVQSYIVFNFNSPVSFNFVLCCRSIRYYVFGYLYFRSFRM